MSEHNSDFFRTMTLVMVSLGVFFVIIIVVANWISEGTGESSQDPRIQAKIEEAIKPAGQVNTEVQSAPTATAAAAGGASADGKGTYQQACFACHGTGAAGAPKVGDKGAWSARIAQGNAKLYDNALKGFQGKSGFMPAKGGNAALSDDAVKAAVDHMVSQSK